MGAGLRVQPVGRELAAAVLAAAGVRRADRVLDLTPGAGLTAGLAAAAGPTGSVTAVLPPEADPPAGVRRAADLAALQRDAPFTKVLLIAPEEPARALEPVLRAVRPLLAPGARVTVAARGNTGALAEGLPAVLAACALTVVHAEGLLLPAGRAALAVGRPAREPRPGIPDRSRL